ncbi:hypothetical protein O3P69_010182 [Scylla paramamosain]|uniref:Uncharacterized protein n=1 Tax=Scylla paramamosain TaxID=85552 RepID=A0AAW0TUG1_SCYPA
MLELCCADGGQLDRETDQQFQTISAVSRAAAAALGEAVIPVLLLLHTGNTSCRNALMIFHNKNVQNFDHRKQHSGKILQEDTDAR